jgi:transposase InsO family protein
MDVCKIGQGLYQYTAIDDCSRYKVMALFKRRTAANSIACLEQDTKEIPFSIQRIQTDRGQEFFAVKFQKLLMEWGIKFRPIKP